MFGCKFDLETLVRRTVISERGEKLPTLGDNFWISLDAYFEETDNLVLYVFQNMNGNTLKAVKFYFFLTLCLLHAKKRNCAATD